MSDRTLSELDWYEHLAGLHRELPLDQHRTKVSNLVQAWSLAAAEHGPGSAQAKRAWDDVERGRVEYCNAIERARGGV